MGGFIMEIKDKILIFFIVMGRFLVDFYSVELSADILALCLVVILAMKHPDSVIVRLSMLITLSIFYSDILNVTQINTDLSILASIGAIITLLIAFTPRYGYTN